MPRYSQYQIPISFIYCYNDYNDIRPERQALAPAFLSSNIKGFYNLKGEMYYGNSKYFPYRYHHL